MAKVKEKNQKLKKDAPKLRFYGLKLRAIPNADQKTFFHKSFGCYRYAKNMYLSERIQWYKYSKENLNYGTFKSFFNQLKLKNGFEWLREVDKFALETGMESVDDAYKRFFKGESGFPKFKSKHDSKQSYSTKMTNNNIKLDYEKQKVRLPKIGWINVRISKKHRKEFVKNGLNAKIKGATVSYHSNGQYFVSLLMEESIPPKPKFDPSNLNLKEVIGCDLGLTHFLIDSDGNKIENHRFLQQFLQSLAKSQRQLKNKKKGSNNYKKQKQKIAKLHLKISNTRKDFLHKQSRKLVNENQVIVLEDLNVKSMIKNRRLARGISDVAWRTFVTYVKYKAEWAGKQVVMIGRFFPSSKECNGCKEMNTMLSLSERTWVCPSCGAEHDRDINAATNIKEEGIRLLNESLS